MKTKFETKELKNQLKEVRAGHKHMALTFINPNKLFPKPIIVKRLINELVKTKIKQIEIEDVPGYNEIIITFKNARYKFHTIDKN